LLFSILSWLSEEIGFVYIPLGRFIAEGSGLVIKIMQIRWISGADML